jgi:hypothetical protein
LQEATKETWVTPATKETQETIHTAEQAMSNGRPNKRITEDWEPQERASFRGGRRRS